jgi:hypothetical protein
MTKSHAPNAKPPSLSISSKRRTEIEWAYAISVGAAWRKPLPSTSISTPSFEGRSLTKQIAEKAVEIALGELGKGEVGANNAGPAIVQYRRGVGGRKSRGSWCAAFISWVYEESARELGFNLPFARSMGAKRLFKNACKAGTKLGPLEIPEAGDLVLWDRGKLGSWQGHIGLVYAGPSAGESHFTTIEGNRGAFPSRVRIYGHELGEGRLEGFCRL